MDLNIFDDENKPVIDHGSGNIFDINNATDVGSMNTAAYDNHINGRPTPKTTLRGLEAALSKAKVSSTEATPTRKPDETARVSSNNPKQSDPLTILE